MTFGEKLMGLRKERGWSQEALAEQLDATRQAVSKWENGQGYPETEKLLKLSNLFGVTVDQLLKPDAEPCAETEPGYYVSHTCAEGFLTFQKKLGRRVSAGIGILIGAGVPYFARRFAPAQFSMGFAAAILLLGIGILVTAAFLEDPYARLSKEILILDSAVYQELKAEAARYRRRALPAVLLAVGLLLAGMFGITGGALRRELCCVLLALGLFGVSFVAGVLEAYDTLLCSGERMQRVHVQVLQRIRNRLAK